MALSLWLQGPSFFPAFQGNKGDEARVDWKWWQLVDLFLLTFGLWKLYSGVVLNLGAKREMFCYYGFKPKHSEIWCNCCELAYFEVDIEVRHFNVAETKLIPPRPLPILPFSQLEVGGENIEAFFPNQYEKKKFWNFPGSLEIRSSLRAVLLRTPTCRHPAVRWVLGSPPRCQAALKDLEESMFNSVRSISLCCTSLYLSIASSKSPAMSPGCSWASHIPWRCCIAPRQPSRRAPRLNNRWSWRFLFIQTKRPKWDLEAEDFSLDMSFTCRLLVRK